MIHGQRADQVIGASPTDMKKVALVVFAIAGGIAAIAAIIALTR